MACHALHDAEPLGARRSSTPSPDAISGRHPETIADVTCRRYDPPASQNPLQSSLSPFPGDATEKCRIRTRHRRISGPRSHRSRRGRPLGTRSCPSRRQAPTASRSARIPGSPASWLSRWAAAMSYSHRIIVNVNPSVSRIAKLARGSASRGWPTEPGLQI